MRYQALLFSALFFVTACDNPGPVRSDPPETVEPNRPPNFFGGDLRMESVPENFTGVITRVLALDPDLDSITFEFTSQEDNDLFSFIDNELSFRNSPDFENPQDADMDNVYVAVVTATDSGGLSSSQTLEITVTDVTDEPALKRVGSGFDKPLALVPVPGDTRLAVVEQGGRIRLLDPSDGAIETVDFLTLTELDTKNEQGLIGLAFAPNFETSGQFYVKLTNKADSSPEIRRYVTFNGRRDMGDPSTEALVDSVEDDDLIDPTILTIYTDSGERLMGVAYEGQLESLAEQLIFGDPVSGNLWTLPSKELSADPIPVDAFAVLTPNVDEGKLEGISTLASGVDGAAYIVTLGGDIFEFIAAE